MTSQFNSVKIVRCESTYLPWGQDSLGVPQDHHSQEAPAKLELILMNCFDNFLVLSQYAVQLYTRGDDFSYEVNLLAAQVCHQVQEGQHFQVDPAIIINN